MKLLAATGNAHKLAEMRAILEPHCIELVTCKDLGLTPPNVVEDLDTFEGNARKKALAYAQVADMPALADDSGLVVDTLGGRPGVRTARYAGECATDRMNYEKLLDELGDTENRQARFVCVISIATPSQIIGSSSGRVEGRITYTPQGTDGFGYDPVFVPLGYDQSFAELGDEIKNNMSHRCNAVKQVIKDNLINMLAER